MAFHQRSASANPVRRSDSRLLSQREAAYVLELPPRAVRNRLRTGRLHSAGPGRLRRIDPEELASVVADRPLAVAAIDAIVNGEFQIPSVPFNGPAASLIATSKWLV